MKSDQDINLNNKNSFLEAEIDFKIIWTLIRKNKNLIINCALIGFILGILYSFTSKRIWKGDFQIVIEENNNSLQQNILNSGVARTLLIGKTASGLSTEVEILKSPSILVDTFEFVKSKIDNKDLNFTDWRKSFNFELIPNTSVLNISYKDTDKTLIKETLNMISQSYQKYSGEKRTRNIELGMNFLQKELPIYKNKALNSLKEAREYAQKNNLFIPANKIINDQKQSMNILPTNQNDTSNKSQSDILEAMRLNITNNLKYINEQISSGKLLENN